MYAGLFSLAGWLYIKSNLPAAGNKSWAEALNKSGVSLLHEAALRLQAENLFFCSAAILSPDRWNFLLHFYIIDSHEKNKTMHKITSPTSSRPEESPRWFQSKLCFSPHNSQGDTFTSGSVHRDVSREAQHSSSPAQIHILGLNFYGWWWWWRW